MEESRREGKGRGGEESEERRGEKRRMLTVREMMFQYGL